jgi:DNA-binding transcriptional MerR regulator
MNNEVATMPAGVPIGVLEREIGLTHDTLQKWELRYGFPVPQRDRRGERVY